MFCRVVGRLKILKFEAKDDMIQCMFFISLQNEDTGNVGDYDESPRIEREMFRQDEVRGNCYVSRGMNMPSCYRLRVGSVVGAEV